jgi:predicted acetyltransferase
VVLKLTPADAPTHDTLLRNLWQFYLYEFSRFTDYVVTPAGRFHENELDGVFTRHTRHPYIIYTDNAVAGFAIVDSGIKSLFTDALNIHYMREFFILTNYQGRGLGAQAAISLFDQYAGHWEVFEMTANTNAQRFWRNLIKRYTTDNYHERTLADGLLQSFNTPSPK